MSAEESDALNLITDAQAEQQKHGFRALAVAVFFEEGCGGDVSPWRLESSEAGFVFVDDDQAREQLAGLLKRGGIALGLMALNDSVDANPCWLCGSLPRYQGNASVEDRLFAAMDGFKIEFWNREERKTARGELRSCH
jgi:hypothetical protein